MSFTDKAVLASGAISAVMAPAAADAAVVKVVQSVSLKVSDLTPEANFDIGFAGWDVDGQNGADFYLAGYRTSGDTQVDYVTYLRYSYAAFGIVNFPGTGTRFPNGNSVFVTTQSAGLARFIESSRVGPALTGNKVGAPFGQALAAYSTVFSTIFGYTYGGSPRYPEGTLHLGTNKIGFKFLAGGNPHYGIADIVLNTGDDPGIEVVRWWYENEPDTEIHVTPVLPSGIAALTLLGLGAAGLRAQRRQKAKQ